MASASFAPLRHRSFTLSLVSSFVSSTGTWMQSVALGVYLTQTTHNALWLGLMTVAAWTPSLLGSPIGGVVADRWNRQHWIQANNFVMALSASALAAAALTHHLSPALACYLAVVEGFCGSASWAANQSLLPDLVQRNEVLAAVSLSSAQFNLGRIIGPMLAGVALALGSPGLCFALNAASFVFVVVMFSFVRSPARPRPTTPVRFVAETIVGARQAWFVKGCRYPILAIAGIAVTVSPFIALVPAMAIDVLHAGKIGTSWLVTAQGVGAVIGGLTLPVLARRTSRVFVLRLSMVSAVVAEALYGVAPNLEAAVVALVVLGAAYVGTLTGLNTSVQLHAPVGERSRILALYTLSLSLAYPLGALVQAALAHSWGVRVITELGAGVGALTLVVVSAALPRVWGEFASPDLPSVQLLAD
ncbi:MAG TPA: MFS transporter [Acidimicrobiales bacterium]|nr:MFS transporter [Acidimicrobiales bacterium]